MLDLTFKEKSTWGLLLSIIALSYYYFPAALEVVANAPAGAGVMGLMGLSLVGVVAFVIFQIVYHILIAASSPAKVSEDERDSLIDLKAERIGSFALGFALILIIGRIAASAMSAELVEPSTALIAVWILAALTLSEVIKLIAVVVYYRIGA